MIKARFLVAYDKRSIAIKNSLEGPKKVYTITTINWDITIGRSFWLAFKE